MGDTDVTADYTDWDKPVTVTAPAAADTVDAGVLAKQLPGGLPGH